MFFAFVFAFLCVNRISKRKYTCEKNINKQEPSEESERVGNRRQCVDSTLEVIIGHLLLLRASGTLQLQNVVGHFRLHFAHAAICICTHNGQKICVYGLCDVARKCAGRML